MSVTEDGAGLRPHGCEVCVLASGSSANCTVVAFSSGTLRRVCLIDAGLSPRRTFKLLAELGLPAEALDDVVLTHLDQDHFQRGWLKALPAHARLWIHQRHVHRVSRHAAHARGAVRHGRLEVFSDSIRLRDGVEASVLMMPHDELGAAVFRFQMRFCDGREASLGFATDVGRATRSLVEHLAGVDVLALESNYCPRLQQASGRPAHLRRRIMGGSGHLSNEEALMAIDRIGPREHVMLLHLSRDCNDPELVASMHAGADYALTITDQSVPSRWVRLTGRRATPPEVLFSQSAPLFSHLLEQPNP